MALLAAFGAKAPETQGTEKVCTWIAYCRSMVEETDVNRELEISADPRACEWLTDTEKVNIDPWNGILENFESDWLVNTDFQGLTDSEGYHETALRMNSGDTIIGTVHLCGGGEDGRNINNGPVRFVTGKNDRIRIDSPNCAIAECSFNGLEIDMRTGLFVEK